MCDEYYGMFILRCVLPVVLVNSKGLFIEKEKDLTAECKLAECFYQSIAMTYAISKQILSRTITESFISGSSCMIVAALLKLPCSAN